MSRLIFGIISFVLMSTLAVAGEPFIAHNGIELDLRRNTNAPVMQVAAPLIRYAVAKHDERTVEVVQWVHFGKWSDIRFDIGFRYRGTPRKYAKAYLENQEELEVNSGATTAFFCEGKGGCTQSQTINISVNKEILRKYVGREFLDVHVYSEDGSNGETIRIPMTHIEAIMFAPVVY